MTERRVRLGRFGEQLASERLERDGMTVLARNCRTRFGELDAVALDGDVLVFVEVKTLRTDARAGPESPLLAVGPRKQIQVRRLARAWLAENAKPFHRSLRFDVVGVSICRDGSSARVEHVRGAF
jgi:putative endonuclease